VGTTARRLSMLLPPLVDLSIEVLIWGNWALG